MRCKMMCGASLVYICPESGVVSRSYRVKKEEWQKTALTERHTGYSIIGVPVPEI